MAVYRPAAAALGAALIAGAVSNAVLSTLTSWTAERFAARLKARLFAKIVSSDQARAKAIQFCLDLLPWIGCPDLVPCASCFCAQLSTVLKHRHLQLEQLYFSTLRH